MNLIPNSSKDLLLSLKRRNNNLTNSNGRNNNKTTKKKEDIEARLMELEDYIFNPSENGRIRRQNEQISMEIEDSISWAFRRQQVELLLKEQIKSEVEMRKRQEIEERERRKRAAEERRAAVLERIRLQSEMEERKRQEALNQLARQRENEERLKREQLEAQMLEMQRMDVEDSRSLLAEQDYREQLEQAAWQQKELERLREYERIQQQRDMEENRKRLERLRELEERKQQLKELQKKTQNLAANKPSDEVLKKSSEEAATLTRQLRIQNRAKFVTKRINNTSDIANTESGSLSKSLPPSQNEFTVDRSDVVAVAEPRGQAFETVALQQSQYISELENVSTENELKQIANELMAEKRTIRQKLHGNDSFKIDQLNSTSDLSHSLQEITQKEEVVNRRMNQLLWNSDPTVVAASAEGNSTVRLVSILSQMSMGTSVESPVVADVSNEVIFKQIELLLQEGHALLEWMRGDGSKAAASLDELQRQQHQQHLRRIAMMPLEISKLIRALEKQFDPINYKDSLTQLHLQLRSLTGKHKDQNESDPKMEPINSSPKNSAPLKPEQQNLVPTVEQTQSDDFKKQILIQPSPVQIYPTVETEKRFSFIEYGNSFHVGESSLTNSPANQVSVSIPAKFPALEAESRRELSSSSFIPAKIEVKNEHELLTYLSDTSIIPQVKEEVVESIETSVECKENINGDSFESEPEVVESDQEAEWAKLPGWDECLNTSMSSAAHHAAFFGHIEVLQMLTGCFDCFVLDGHGRTPLFYAALQNRLDCVACLVELDPQWIDVGDNNGETPLHAAASADGTEVLQFLLLCEGNPDTANNLGMTPCHVARSVRALEVLCQAGAQAFCIDSKSRNPLWFACNEGRLEAAQYLCSVTPSLYILWQDDQGDSPLHRAAANGHHQIVETVCQWLPKSEDLKMTNNKGYSAAHVATSAAVLKALYESGADLWQRDSKGRMPLFVASFMGHVDCVAFLIDLAISEKNIIIVSSADCQGDTPLHAACLKGHLKSAILLLYFCRCVRNNANLLPHQLAEKAGHSSLAAYVQNIETQKKSGLTSAEIFGCEFSNLSATMLFFGSRWTKGFDHTYDSFYYVDRITGQTQWERPAAFDESQEEEDKFDTACNLLKLFYINFNPEKLKDINGILVKYRNKYTDLFIQLAEKYQVDDLSIFDGVVLD